MSRRAPAVSVKPPGVRRRAFHPRDLNVIDVLRFQSVLEDAVAEARTRRFCTFFAEVVIDAVNLVLFEYATALSCSVFAVARSRPNGFSTMTRTQEFSFAGLESPALPSCR